MYGSRASAKPRPKAQPLRVGSLVAGFIAVMAALLVAMPFIISVSTSLMTLREALSFPPKLAPSNPQWANYLRAWQGAPFERYFANSLIISISITVGQIITSILAAYAFSRLRFPGRNALFGLFLATLMVPSYVVLIPNYLTLSRLGTWSTQTLNLNLGINSYAALILPFLASGFSVFLIRQRFKGVPRDLEDAAMIDGASRWIMLWRIFVPLARPSIATAALFTFLSEWNSYLWPLIVTDTDRMRTVQIGLASFQAVSEEEGLTHWPVLLAASVIVLVPTLIAFVLAERQLIRGVTLSGLKG